MRKLIITVCIVASTVTLIAIFVQRRELSALKVQASKPQQQANQATESTAQFTASIPPPHHAPSSELLRLRGEVGRLERRKRELAGVHAEKENLLAQLPTHATNAPRGIVLPAGYIRKADARLGGFNTPEDTIQSMLWAIQNRDTATFVQLFDPEVAKHMEAEIQRRGSAEEFFQGAEAMPGLRILKKENTDDGGVELTIEVVPGEEFPRPLYLKKFAGQWKLVSGL